MTKMRVILLFTIICLCSCQATAPHEKEGDKFIARFIARAYRTHDLRLLGSGGSFLDDIKKFNFLFYSIDPIDNVEDARKLFVSVIEELLESINSDPNLQPYLHKTPFDFNNVQVGIHFYKSNGEFMEPPYIASVCIIKGNIHYAHYINEELESIFDEPYPEAKQIVEQQASLHAE